MIAFLRFELRLRLFAAFGLHITLFFVYCFVFFLPVHSLADFLQSCRKLLRDLFNQRGVTSLFAWSPMSHASLAAKEFFELCLKVFPFPITFVLTDNGSEFMKHFEEELKNLHMIHYHERFNRTIQDEFVDYHIPELVVPEAFNCKLIDYIVWYNTERVHYAFENKLSPVQFMLNLPQQVVAKIPTECKSG